MLVSPRRFFKSLPSHLLDAQLFVGVGAKFSDEVRQVVQAQAENPFQVEVCRLRIEVLAELFRTEQSYTMRRSGRVCFVNLDSSTDIRLKSLRRRYWADAIISRMLSRPLSSRDPDVTHLGSKRVPVS